MTTCQSRVQTDLLHERSAGVTFVELLTVIAIVTLLVALVLTATNVAKRKAQQTQCANNLRQQGIALHQFLADNHVYPLHVNWDYPLGNYREHQKSWNGALAIAGGLSTGQSVSRVWHCPSVTFPPGFPGGTGGFVDYGYNAFGLGKDDSPDGLGSLGLGSRGRFGVPPRASRPIAESEVANPSQMMAIADGFIGQGGVLSDGEFTFWRVPSIEKYPGSTKHANARHHGRANVAFCDGHGQFLSLEFLFVGSTDLELRRWNRDNQPHRERAEYSFRIR